jgi:hypothetical protein
MSASQAAERLGEIVRYSERDPQAERQWNDDGIHASGENRPLGHSPVTTLLASPIPFDVNHNNLLVRREQLSRPLVSLAAGIVSFPGVSWRPSAVGFGPRRW